MEWAVGVQSFLRRGQEEGPTSVFSRWYFASNVVLQTLDLRGGDLTLAVPSDTSSIDSKKKILSREATLS